MSSDAKPLSHLRFRFSRASISSLICFCANSRFSAGVSGVLLLAALEDSGGLMNSAGILAAMPPRQL